MFPNPWRLLRSGWIKGLSELNELTIDDVDLMNLYLDAQEEAMIEDGES